MLHSIYQIYNILLVESKNVLSCIYNNMFSTVRSNFYWSDGGTFKMIIFYFQGWRYMECKNIEKYDFLKIKTIIPKISHRIRLFDHDSGIEIHKFEVAQCFCVSMRYFRIKNPSYFNPFIHDVTFLRLRFFLFWMYFKVD